MPTVYVLAPCPQFVVGDRGQRYLARACAASRSDGQWDRWFIFLPFGYGLPVATDRETVDGMLGEVKSWAEAMTTGELQDMLQRAQACWPEALLARRGPRAA
jgi:hypothetical protein